MLPDDDNKLTLREVVREALGVAVLTALGYAWAVLLFCF